MATPAFIVRLMHHKGLSSTACANLGPEDAEAYRFAQDLRQASLEGRLLAVWTHPANELAGVGKTVGGKFRVSVQSAIAKALGLITGTSDYLFLFRGGSIAMEFKAADGSLRSSQRDFRDWCLAMGVPFHVVRSRAEALEVLRGAGVLVKERGW